MKLTLGLAHELGLCASLTASLLIVLLGGEFPVWVWLAAFAPLLSLLLRRRERPPARQRMSGGLLALAAIGAGVASLARVGMQGAVFAGGATLVGILAARVLTRTTLAHDLQAIAVSLVLVLAGSVLNVGMSYFLVFVGYAISTVWSLSTRQLLAGATQTGMAEQEVRARDDVITPLFFVGSAAVSLGVLAAALVVFISFPRIGFGELGFLNQKDSKLPASVGFGSDPRALSRSTELVARVRGVPAQSFEEGLYLRGIVYDEINLDAFSQSAPDATTAPIIDSRPMLTALSLFDDRLVRYEVTLSPVGGDLLFTLGHVRVVQVVAGGAANPNRSVQIGGRDRHDELKAIAALSSPLRYEIQGSASPPGGTPRELPTVRPVLKDRERYLKVPSSSSIDALLAGVQASAAALDQARPRGQNTDQRKTVGLLRSFFIDNFRYSLEGELAGREKPLEAFILDVRAGHCELFAGAFALLLRKAGVPARVVGGFQGGALAPDGTIVFQQRHAHAWVEWWSDDFGWIVDDATPEPTARREQLGRVDGLLDSLQRFWDDRVVDYSLADQQNALQSVRAALAHRNLGRLAKSAAVIVVVVALLLFAWRRARRGSDGSEQVDELAHEILRAIVRLQPETSVASLSTATLREAISGLEHEVLGRAVGIYEAARFGSVAVAEPDLRPLVAALRALKKP